MLGEGALLDRARGPEPRAPPFPQRSLCCWRGGCSGLTQGPRRMTLTLRGDLRCSPICETGRQQPPSSAQHLRPGALWGTFFVEDIIREPRNLAT